MLPHDNRITWNVIDSSIFYKISNGVKKKIYLARKEFKTETINEFKLN